MSSVISVSSLTLALKSKRFFNGPTVRLTGDDDGSLWASTSFSVGDIALPVVNQFFKVPPFVLANEMFSTLCLFETLSVVLIELSSSKPKNSLVSPQSFAQSK